MINSIRRKIALLFYGKEINKLESELYLLRELSKNVGDKVQINMPEPITFN